MLKAIFNHLRTKLLRGTRRAIIDEAVLRIGQLLIKHMKIPKELEGNEIGLEKVKKVKLQELRLVFSLLIEFVKLYMSFGTGTMSIKVVTLLVSKVLLNQKSIFSFMMQMKDTYLFTRAAILFGMIFNIAREYRMSVFKKLNGYSKL